ncbi:SAG-related sequence SRS22G [Toxoplasma gondii ME49]|uniref:SRS22G n=3 Tax=Toxoplasma gondii TaxID=5811 RepID=B6KGD4_TOXGV|nr:SAG-related sequence SRS22G [Toxoplasma gondii ME49]EPT30831.1 SAG-related sequence SRS22G [Toxoplasma gondii ME49]ESS31259.1 SAG-related sequence SRS22G [Toxoplasma gondii VEG]KFG56895.1 SAG-related sequence SRS22G [Toxoplasma gondii RUB]CEL73518.1 TPA: SRS22G [Toxoplasma gondii VEG]|eukprot:XP_002366534.1 SAG-related sequence SRS22G [Toxoplasma gondii ME49]
MKFSLLTLGALAFSAHQAAIVQGDEETTGQPKPNNVCSANSSLTFNLTRAGESVVFTCGETVTTLDPEFNATFPEMYEGNSKVRILEFLPDAKLEEVKNSVDSSRASVSGNTYNFTVPVLPSDEHHLHVNCTAAGEKSKSTVTDCQVFFHIASSAIRPVMAASAIVSLVASLLQFA